MVVMIKLLLTECMPLYSFKPWSHLCLSFACVASLERGSLWISTFIWLISEELTSTCELAPIKIRNMEPD